MTTAPTRSRSPLSSHKGTKRTPPEAGAITTAEFAKLLNCSTTMIYYAVKYEEIHPINPPSKYLIQSGAYFFSATEVTRILDLTREEAHAMRRRVIARSRGKEVAS